MQSKHPACGSRELNSQAKVKDDDKKIAVQQYLSGKTAAEIAHKYGVCVASVRSWVQATGKTTGETKGWKGEVNGRAKLTDGDVKHIKRLLKLGMSLNSVARVHQVSWPTIKRISNGSGWSHVSD